MEIPTKPYKAKKLRNRMAGSHQLCCVLSRNCHMRSILCFTSHVMSFDLPPLFECGECLICVPPSLHRFSPRCHLLTGRGESTCLVNTFTVVIRVRRLRFWENPKETVYEGTMCPNMTHAQRARKNTRLSCWSLDYAIYGPNQGTFVSLSEWIGQTKGSELID